MSNELELGTRRSGDFIDFYPETPEVKVTLERSDKGISITLPWSDPGSPYAHWFTANNGWIQPESGQAPPPVPRRVLFNDSHGPVLLIRCWAKGFHSNLIGPGSGTLWGRAAILGVDRDIEFDRPHGLQTEISGLRAWMGVTSWQESIERGTGALEAGLSSKRVVPIDVGAVNGLSLQFWPSWELMPEDESDQRILRDKLRVVTRSDQPVEWDIHIDVHNAIRDLLVLSRWHAESCIEVLALRVDDPLRMISGLELGEQWRPVVVADHRRTPSPSDGRQHLITYDDLQAEGINRWLNVRELFSRALDPIISCINLRDVTANTLLAQAGPGLEALGYLLMIREGVPARRAAQTSLKLRFSRILEDLGGVLPFDSTEWANETAEAYNGIKHANRKQPDMVAVLNVWRRSVMVVRAWVALELGVPASIVSERLALDPQRHEYVKVG